jgi:hypothetical protein
MCFERDYYGQDDAIDLEPPPGIKDLLGLVKKQAALIDEQAVLIRQLEINYRLALELNAGLQEEIDRLKEPQ